MSLLNKNGPSRVSASPIPVSSCRKENELSPNLKQLFNKINTTDRTFCNPLVIKNEKISNVSIYVSILKYTTFENCVFTNVTFSSNMYTIEQCQFIGCEFNNVAFNYCTIFFCSFDRNLMNNVAFNNCDLDSVSIIACRLEQCSFKFSSLNRSVALTDSALIDCDFERASFPLWCGTLKVLSDDRLVKQLLYHALHMTLYSQLVSEDLKAALLTPELMGIADDCHMIENGTCKPLSTVVPFGHHKMSMSCDGLLDRLPISGYVGMYDVDINGNIYSHRSRKYLKVAMCHGTTNVVLCCKGVRKNHDVPRLVANAFISNPDNKPYVCHIDGDPTNNKVSNLFWSEHASDTKLSKKGKIEHD